ncbi:hypothetical protein IAQ61_002042 [Plenodomus lingam]|uniref:uncharacterized protein n=1 Tax=Leptosphaeria maculans TaxID=5022 RepID=UPI00332D0F68|nr:hypothetical protein IAQ61_002042 [Plenodomus lingam]
MGVCGMHRRVKESSGNLELALLSLPEAHDETSSSSLQLLSVPEPIRPHCMMLNVLFGETRMDMLDGRPTLVRTCLIMGRR